MPQALSRDIIALLADGGTRKLLSFVDSGGIPRISAAQYLHAGADGLLHYLTLNETSPLHQAMVRGIWFDQSVTIALLSSDGRGVTITGRPIKTLLTGPVFLDYYLRLRDTTGEDLACIWLIEPDEVSGGETLEQERPRPGTYEVLHLDRIARQAG